MRLGEVAARLGDRPVQGDADFTVTGVASLEDGGPDALGFVRSARHASALAHSKIGAVIAPPEVEVGGRPAIRSPSPSLDFARAVALLAPPPRPAPGIHESARIAHDVAFGEGVAVGAGAVVEAGSAVGDRSVLHPNVTLYADVRVGADCVIHAGVVLREGSVLGDRVVIQPGAVIGGDGFGFEIDEQGRWEKVPQIGNVVVEDDVEIGAGTTVDRARLGSTRIGRGVKLDNLVQIGHGCQVGADSVIVAQSGIAGGTVLGRRVIMMCQSGVAGATGPARIGDGTFIAARAGVYRDLEPGSRVWGFPALPERRWHRAVAVFAKLPELLRRVRALERQGGEGPRRTPR